MDKFTSKYWTVGELEKKAKGKSDQALLCEDILTGMRAINLDMSKSTIVVSEQYHLRDGKNTDCLTSVGDAFWHSKYRHLQLHEEFDYEFDHFALSVTLYVIPGHVFALILKEYDQVCAEQEHLFDGSGAEGAYASFYFEHTMDSCWLDQNTGTFHSLRDLLKEKGLHEVISDGRGEIAQLPDEVRVHRGCHIPGLYGDGVSIN